MAYIPDTVLTECINNADASYSSRYDCVYLRQVYYKAQNDKLINELKSRLSKQEYSIVMNNQNLLFQYVQSLKNGEIKILDDTQGLMYQTFAQEILLMVYETNFQILSLVANNSYNRDKLLQNQKQKSLNEYMQELKQNLTSTQYKKIIQSQKRWEIYKNDVERHLLPLFSDFGFKKYIQNIIVEDRINSLININFIFVE